MPPYVLITPAHNEEALIEQTIKSVIRQTIKPQAWIIANDASTDHTADKVEKYAQHTWIRLINVKRDGGRHFGHKVHAFNAGLAEADHFGYRYIGNLDADISMTPDYFEQIICEFERDPKLGIAGGMVSSWINDQFVSQNVALDSVAGAVQMFRRSCFEQIGGYLSLPQGGIDAAAEVMARMKGWTVRTFPELQVREHRRTGSSTARPLGARVNEGRRLYSLGYGLSFFLLRCVYRSMEKPRIIGSGAALFGYLQALLRRAPLLLPADAIQYLRAEQRSKIGRALGLLKAHQP